MKFINYNEAFPIIYNFYDLCLGSAFQHKSTTLLLLGPLHTRAKSHDHKIVRAQKKVSKGRPNISKIMWCGHGSSSVVWSPYVPGPQPNAISMNYYSCGFSHTIKYNTQTVASIWSAMVSRFCVRPTSKR